MFTTFCSQASLVNIVLTYLSDLGEQIPRGMEMKINHMLSKQNPRCRYMVKLR